MSEEQQVSLEPRKLYIADLSVEVPRAPEVFQEEVIPEISFNISFKNQKLPPEHYHEVRLTLSVTAKEKDSEKVIYVVEATQCGIFEIIGIEGDNLRHALNTYCTNLLYPFAREVISDAIVRAGFPALFLQPVNFDALYQHQLMQEAAEAQK